MKGEAWFSIHMRKGVVMLFDWLKQKRRQRVLAQSFPIEWDAHIRNNVLHFAELTLAQQGELRKQIQLFVAGRNWEGCRGLKITDEIRVTIAAQACMLTIGLGVSVFDHVQSILVYPSEYIAPETTVAPSGVHIEGGQNRLGEAWYRGPVILSWEHALAGGRLETPGHNLVLHEFAHQLDMQSGGMINGTPQLSSNAQLQRWERVLQPEFNRLRESCRLGLETPIDCYGTKNEGEFFAVLTESFFERARELQMHSPDAYALLAEYYGLDPGSWDSGFGRVRQQEFVGCRHQRQHCGERLLANFPT